MIVGVLRYELARNATTLWEEFNGGGTHNHIMFGTQSSWYFQHLAGIQTSQRVNRSVVKDRTAWSTIRLKPSVSCEYLRGDLNLTAVNATLDSPRGVVRSSWQLWQCPVVPPAPTPPTPPDNVSTCALALEKDRKYQPNASGVAYLGCGVGRVIASVPYAEFGYPSGNCTWTCTVLRSRIVLLCSVFLPLVRTVSLSQV